MSTDNLSVENMLDSLSDRLRIFAESVKIVGEPITHGDKIIIPVISVSTGFAGAGGGGKGGKQAEGQGSVGAGGAGIRISPQGFLVITDEDVKLLGFGTKTRVESLANAIPNILDKVRTLKDSGKGEG